MLASKRVCVDADVTRAIHELETFGVTIFQIFSKAELEIQNCAILDMVKTYPEFQTSSYHPVMGGFGAHATPSSYHNPTVQSLRSIVYERFSNLVIPTLAKKHGYPFWHMLFDRVCTRGPDSGVMTAESWHFDHCDDRTNSNIPSKQLTGGWINLNLDKDQYFYGLKGTMGTDYIQGGKYRPLPKELHPTFEALLKEQGGPIVIPPGWLVCFKPELTHKVCPGRTDKLGVRLYLGAVMSSHEIPLYNFGRDEILANRLGFTGSGQRPATWAVASWMFRPAQISEWTETMKPHKKYLETVTVSPSGKGKNAGKTFTRVKRFMLDPVVIYAYAEKDLSIMLPMQV